MEGDSLPHRDHLRRELRSILLALARGPRDAEAREAFLTRVSHELRTPLNAILGYSELLEEEAVSAGHTAMVPDLQKIHGAGQNLLHVIDELVAALAEAPLGRAS